MTGWKEIIVWEFYDAKQNLHGSKYVGEMIRCKDCKHFDKDEFCNIWEVYRTNESYCDIAERKDEYVTLHHEDIHFIDEDAEREFYKSLAERKEE